MFKILRTMKAAVVCLCLVFSAHSVVLGVSVENITRETYTNCKKFVSARKVCYRCNENNKAEDHCFDANFSLINAIVGFFIRM